MVPVAAKASRLSRKAKVTPSSTARYRWWRPWCSPRPRKHPLAWASQKFHQVGGDFSSQVNSLFRRVDAFPRRIDYLFVYPPSGLDSINPTSDLGCLGHLLKASRFGFLSGNPLASEGLGVHLDSTFAQRPERACARRPKEIVRQSQSSSPWAGTEISANGHECEAAPGGRADTLFAGKAEWTAKVAIER